MKASEWKITCHSNTKHLLQTWFLWGDWVWVNSLSLGSFTARWKPGGSLMGYGYYGSFFDPFRLLSFWDLWSEKNTSESWGFFLTGHGGNRRLQPPLLFGIASVQVLRIAKSCVLWVLEVYLNRKMALLWNLCFFQMIACVSQNRLRKNPPAFMTMILLKEEILHQLIWQISQYLQGLWVLYISTGAGFLASTVPANFITNIMTQKKNYELRKQKKTSLQFRHVGIFLSEIPSKCKEMIFCHSDVHLSSWSIIIYQPGPVETIKFLNVSDCLETIHVLWRNMIRGAPVASHSFWFETWNVMELARLKVREWILIDWLS